MLAILSPIAIVAVGLAIEPVSQPAAPVPYESVRMPGDTYSPYGWQIVGDIVAAGSMYEPSPYTPGADEDPLDVDPLDEGPMVYQTCVWRPGYAMVTIDGERLERLSDHFLVTAVEEWNGGEFRSAVEFRVRKVSDLFPRADFDGDGDVDMSDFGVLQRSLGGSDSRFDLNGDGWVDGRDVDAFDRKMRVR